MTQGPGTEAAITKGTSKRWKYAAKAVLPHSKSSSTMRLDTLVSSEIARKALDKITTKPGKRSALVNIQFAHNTGSNNVSIPSWSTQDRLPRLQTTTTTIVELTQSNLLVGVLFIFQLS